MSQTTRGRRGPYAKTAARREAILNAALDVFGQQGYHAGSLREVSAIVGLSEAGVLHHFASKAELLTAVLDRRDEMIEVAVPPAALGEERLRRMLAIAQQNALHPGVIELFVRLGAEATAEDHPAHDFFVRRLDFVRQQFRYAFADLDDRGLLAPGVDVDSAIVISIAVWDGLQLQWLTDRDVDIPAELARHLQLLTTVSLDRT